MSKKLPLRSLLVTALVAVLSVPQEARAQLFPTWCMPGQSACFGVTAFEYMAEVPNGTFNQTDWSITGVWTGAALDGLSGLTWSVRIDEVFATITGTDGGSAAFDPGSPTSIARQRNYNVTHVGSLQRNSTIDDVSFISWGADGAGCSPNGRDGAVPACVAGASPTTSVPEPSAYMLILVGVAGLGLVGYRRRDEVFE